MEKITKTDLNVGTEVGEFALNLETSETNSKGRDARKQHEDEMIANSKLNSTAPAKPVYQKQKNEESQEKKSQSAGGHGMVELLNRTIGESAQRSSEAVGKTEFYQKRKADIKTVGTAVLTAAPSILLAGGVAISNAVAGYKKKVNERIKEKVEHPVNNEKTPTLKK